MKKSPRLNKPAPARIYGYVARKADVALLIRRYPTQWFQLIRWDLNTGTLEYGQWFRGRIYQDRSDLSPDGKYFLYFARKITAKSIKDTEYTYAWTAISRVPYYTALALWPKGDCWNGGGLWDGARKIWLNHEQQRSSPHPNHRPPRAFTVRAELDHRGEDHSVLPKRLERDGWEFIHALDQNPFESLGKVYLNTPETWEKVNGRRKIRWRRWYGRGWQGEFDWAPTGSDEWKILADTWADFDHRGRLLFAFEGRLYAADPGRKPDDANLIADLSSAEHASLAAPFWAQRW